MNDQLPVNVPSVVLPDGSTIPQIGLGVLRVSHEQMRQAVRSALNLGYRHIDAAAGYENEGSLGQVLAETGFHKGSLRKSLWVTTKIKDSEQGYDSALYAFDRQLKALGLDYVDMYMIHWPTPFNWRSDTTWKAFARLRSEGRIRCIGVCNFMPKDLQRLYDEVGELPVINQIELHPTWQQREVTDFCKQHGIALEAYSPLARGKDLEATRAIVEPIAQRYLVTPAQVILRWHIEHGFIVIPKSVTPCRQKENLHSASFCLTEEEVCAIDQLDGEGRMGHDPATFSYA